MSWLPSREQVVELLARPLPYGDRPAPLRDPHPDPGLFGPGSVTWRVMREPVLILGGGRALLMQAAHPLVAQGAIDHSSYATDPFGRLERTVDWVTICCFGTTAEARLACRRVNVLHRSVRGELPQENRTSAYPAGTPYSADDPPLLLWVHASFVDAMLASHDALVGTLRRRDRDAFVQEWEAVGLYMGVPKAMLPKSFAELRNYVDQQIASGAARPGPGSGLVARTVLDPPLPSVALVPGWQLVKFVTMGLLPAEVRDAYELRWTVVHERAHRRLCATVATLRPRLPRRFRVSPIYDMALERTRGRWPAARAA